MLSGANERNSLGASSHLWSSQDNFGSKGSFWHETDKYTITSKKYIWAYPGSIVTGNYKSICVLPELNDQCIKNFSGLCSDFIESYK